MNTLKLASILFLGLLTSSMLIVSNHKINDAGQTELIKYVAQQDKSIQKAEQEVYKIESDCFRDVRRASSKSRRYVRIGTPEQLRSLAKAQETLDNLIDTTSKKIETIASLHPSELSAQDNSGKTALNYCFTDSTYNKLREVGVPFQYETWMYFNQANLIAALIATGMLTAYGMNWLNEKSKNSNQDKDTDKDKDKNY